MNPYTAIANAAIERLAPLHRDAGGYLHAIEPYNGEFTGKRGLDDIKRALLGRQPAILVTTGTTRTRVRALDRRKRELDVDLILFIVSAHWSSPVAQRAGDELATLDPTLDPGVDEIRWDALELILADQGRLLSGSGFTGKRVEHEDDTPIEVPGGMDGASGLTVWRSRYSLVVTLLEEPRAGKRFDLVEGRHNIGALDDDGAPVLPVDPVVVTETTANG